MKVSVTARRCSKDATAAERTLLHYRRHFGTPSRAGVGEGALILRAILRCGRECFVDTLWVSEGPVKSGEGDVSVW